MRITSSTLETNIFPSPIFPVRALSVMTSTTLAAFSSGTRIWILTFRQEINRVFSAAIQLRMAFLASETFDFFDRHTLYARFGQRFFDFVQLEGLHNRFDILIETP